MKKLIDVQALLNFFKELSPQSSIENLPPSKPLIPLDCHAFYEHLQKDLEELARDSKNRENLLHSINNTSKIFNEKATQAISKGYLPLKPFLKVTLQSNEEYFENYEKRRKLNQKIFLFLRKNSNYLKEFNFNNNEQPPFSVNDVSVFIDYSNIAVGARTFLENFFLKDPKKYVAFLKHYAIEKESSAFEAEIDIENFKIPIDKFYLDIEMLISIISANDKTAFYRLENPVPSFIRYSLKESCDRKYPKQASSHAHLKIFRTVEQLYLAGSCRPLRSCKVEREDFSEKIPYLHLEQDFKELCQAAKIKSERLSFQGIRKYFPIVKMFEIINLQRIFRDEQYIEQGVDEILQFKILDFVVMSSFANVTFSKHDRKNVLCVVTGDGAPSEFGSGFLSLIITLLGLGWTIELYAWRMSLNNLYYYLFAIPNFKFYSLELFAHQIIRLHLGDPLPSEF